MSRHRDFRCQATAMLAGLMIGCLSLAGATSHAASGPAGPAGASAPKRPKNVLVILTDDVGFAASSTFGGPIQTPTFDALAKQGLRYNNFHTTPMCSPTRAALLTGRNSHAVEMGSITESASADRGYTSVIPKSAATVARVLKDRGFRTALFGKYHLIPKSDLSTVGPFDHWPTSMGFDYFYGFEPAMVDQFMPNLIENTRVIAPPQQPDYFFERDLANRTIRWLRELRSSGQGSPFFSISRPQRRMLRCRRRPTGSRSIAVDSIAAGTSSAKKCWRVRSGSASSRLTRC